MLKIHGSLAKSLVTKLSLCPQVVGRSQKREDRTSLEREEIKNTYKSFEEAQRPKNEYENSRFAKLDRSRGIKIPH